MIVFEGFESVMINSMWLLDPPIQYMLPELGRRGYTVTGMMPQIPIPQPIFPFPPNVIAFKAYTRVLYDPGRRVLGVEGISEDDVYRSFIELEEVLRSVGGDLQRGTIFYEFISRGRARGCRLQIGDIEISSPESLKLSILPLVIIKRDSSPLDRDWIYLEIRPIWTSWGSEQIYYEIFTVYRGGRDEVLKFLKHSRTFVAEIMKTASDRFCSK
ncbi:conserved hypothetical protein [Ignisphaera aggregans DSM 17230]|uniref:Uncharacterized protein n=1 Tax=Ignisphaera aggregans (strain DSM 17230 / JCM 13409 / AQ1.S1) TaxID=583356 RepID=E0SSC2_IGNAA|nr:conserved hypothetical protein [Ignisphaera aggregans DSM 17230]